MQLLIISLISLYQRALSPDHGVVRVVYPFGFCRYYPTCSEYARHALCAYGVIRGSARAMARISRCTPWSKGGVDMLT